MRISIYGLLLTLILFACQEKISLGEDVRDRFFIEVDNALLPVTVKGNTASKTMLIVLHGGPGGNASVYEEFSLFEQIEASSAVVYFDQRCSGSSQGNCNIASLEMVDYLSDIDLLIEILEARYGEDNSLFLLGHSWGGSLAANYVLSAERQAKLNGCFIVDGIHDFSQYIDQVRQMTNIVGQSQIDQDLNSEIWKEHIEELEALTDGEPSDISTANQIANQLEQLLPDSLSNADIKINDIVNYYFFSSYELFAATSNVIGANLGLFDEYSQFDISGDLSNVTLPIASYVGKFDFVAPPYYAEEIRDSVQSSFVDYEFFELSGHSPMINEKIKFNHKVNAFIKLHK